MPVMLDLCSGLRGASQAMKDRGWRVIAVDTLEWLKPDIVADVRALPLEPFPCDLLWASPPCTEYTRKMLPWLRRTAAEPDVSIWAAIQSTIAEWAPRYWCIENVQGAVPYHGKCSQRLGSRYLWTNLPRLPRVPMLSKRYTLDRRHSPLRYWLNSKIEYALSEAIASIVETS